jgi:hypothetical protein
MPFWRIRCSAGSCKAFCREGAPHMVLTDIKADFFKLLSYARPATLGTLLRNTLPGSA